VTDVLHGERLMDVWIDKAAVCINTFGQLCVFNLSWLQFNLWWTCYKSF